MKVIRWQKAKKNRGKSESMTVTGIIQTQRIAESQSADKKAVILKK